MTNQKKAVLTILVTFLIGAVAGVLVDQTFLRGSVRFVKPESRYEKFKSRMFQELDLDIAQEAQLEQLLQRRQEAFNEFRKTLDTKFLEMRQATRDSIRSLLTPAQLTKFEAIVNELDATHRRGRRK